jgi:hypothetical protein
MLLGLLACSCQRSDVRAALGVPGCDAFLQKAEQCATQIGRSTVRGTELLGFAGMQRKNWAGSDRASLPPLCATTINEMRRTYPECTW